MTMADIILNEQDKQQYNAYLAQITDCCHRMASNRDEAYRQKQMSIATKALEHMTLLLEQAEDPKDQ